MNLKDALTQLRVVGARREGQGDDNDVVIEDSDGFRLMSGVRFKAPNLVVIEVESNEPGASD